MTLAELRATARYLAKETETDVGTLWPSDNTLLDLFLNWGLEQVCLDLVEFLPETFLTYEDVSLVADDPDYTLTAEWLQIWAIQKSVTSEAPKLIPYRDVKQLPFKGYTGETAEHPKCWYLKGRSIYFWPTPSTAKTSYARVWIIAPEAATIVTAGPAIIPRITHKLIPVQACILAAIMNEQYSDYVNRLETLYGRMLIQVRGVLGSQVQQQPRFLGESVLDLESVESRDKAFYDLAGFWD
jgi:hypothetical protein